MGLTSDFKYNTPQIGGFNPGQNNYDNAVQQAQSAAIEGLQAGEFNAQQQQALADALRAQMEGRGPSLAQQQLASGLERARRQAAGAIGSVRGLTPMQAAMARGRAEATLSADAVQQANMLRVKEQLSAQEQLSNLLGTSRAQDIGAQGEKRSLYGTTANAKMGEMEIGAKQADLDFRRQAAQADQEQKNAEARAKLLGAGLGAAGSLLALAGGGQIGPDGEVIGGRAVKDGNSYENDTVPAMLSPGEIVLPRSVTQAEDAPEKAKAFVEAIKSEKTKKQPKGFGQVLMRLREIEQRIASLEGDE